MAENSGAGGAEKGLGRALFRKMGRTKERVLQNLGKADRTTDNEYDQLVNLFTEQHNVANRLLKEVKSYMVQVKAMAVASQSIYETLAESYESSWKNADRIIPATEELIALWDDRLEKLNNDLQAPLLKYADQFREVKKKIEKRSRKLVDFDGKRHNVESLENAKKRDETKISKAHEELNAAKSIYETIHHELCEELPALYQSRIPTLCNYFSALVSSEAAFQTDCAKIKTRLAELTECETELIVSRSPAVKKPSNMPPRPPVVQRSIDHAVHEEKQPKTEKGAEVDQANEYLTLVECGGSPTANRVASDSSDDENEEEKRAGGEGASPTHSTNSDKNAGSAGINLTSSGRIGGSNKELELAAGNPRTFHSSSSSIESNPKNTSRTEGMTESPLASSQTSIDRKGSKGSIEEELRNREEEELMGKRMADEAGTTAAAAKENGKESDEGEIEEKSSGNVSHHRKSSSSEEEEEEEKATGGARYLYKVVAIHSYEAVDVDELSFEKGEVIGILPFEESSDEQDDGWLFGVKSSTGEKGVFPMNFTSKT